MSKEWKDANEVFGEPTIVPKKLKMYEQMMTEIPKHKKKYDNSHKVYEKNEYIILKVYSGSKVGFIVYNTNKEWEGGHTHLNSFDMAKTIISNVIQHKKPKTNNVYLMKSHIRISNDEKYIRYIEDLIMVKRSKPENKYYNRI